jgi:diguanylate cyclase
VGVAHSQNGETLKKTLKRADMALYQAKENGRNRVMVSARA